MSLVGRGCVISKVPWKVVDVLCNFLIFLNALSPSCNDPLVSARPTQLMLGVLGVPRSPETDVTFPRNRSTRNVRNPLRLPAIAGDLAMGGKVYYGRYGLCA